MKKQQPLTIEALRKKNLWPFPEWKDGKIVVKKIPKKRSSKPNWFKETGEALL